MTQHLYPCEDCGRTGVAHYHLRAGRLALVCTACHRALKKKRPAPKPVEPPSEPSL